LPANTFTTGITATNPSRGESTTLTPAPEPTSTLLLACGSTLLLGYRRRRVRAK
jgi:hypothetical protein